MPTIGLPGSYKNSMDGCPPKHDGKRAPGHLETPPGTTSYAVTFVSKDVHMASFNTNSAQELACSQIGSDQQLDI